MRIFGGAAGEAHSAHPGFCYRIYDTYQQLQENPATPGPLPELDVDWDQERAKL